MSILGTPARSVWLGIVQCLCSKYGPAFVLAGGTSGGGAYTTGPENSLLFYVFYLYKVAFQYSDMGYAAAMAWVLFIISIVLAFAIMRWSRYWVHYEGA